MMNLIDLLISILILSVDKMKNCRIFNESISFSMMQLPSNQIAILFIISRQYVLPLIMPTGALIPGA